MFDVVAEPLTATKSPPVVVEPRTLSVLNPLPPAAIWTPDALPLPLSIKK